jgi:hypothetical protein
METSYPTVSLQVAGIIAAVVGSGLAALGAGYGAPLAAP